MAEENTYEVECEDCIDNGCQELFRSPCTGCGDTQRRNFRAKVNKDFKLLIPVLDATIERWERESLNHKDSFNVVKKNGDIMGSPVMMTKTDHELKQSLLIQEFVRELRILKREVS